MVKIELVNSERVRGAIDRLLDRASHPRPAFFAIGERVAESTKQRFAQGVAPDGTQWAPNQRSTVEHYLWQKSGVFDKGTGKRNGTKKSYFRNDGRLSEKGAAVLAAKKPLHGLTGLLADSIFYNVVADGVEIGSPMVYSAMQQFGGKRAYSSNLRDA